MKKFIVTGGAGFIGSNLAEGIVRAGHQAIVVDDFSASGRRSFDAKVPKRRLLAHKANLTNYREALRVIRGADAVFHLAARVGGIVHLHGGANSEAAALQENITIDANVFRAAAANGIREIIYASSVAVYPMAKQRTYGAVFREDEFDAANIKKFKLDPDGGYGWSKVIGELQLHQMKRVKVGIARLFNIYGVHEPVADKSHAISDLIKKSMAYPKQDFVVWGDGRQTRDYLYVTDCAAALLKLEKKVSSLQEGMRPIVLNVGSGVAVPIREIARIAIKISGKKIAPVYDSKKLKKFIGPVSRTADTKKVTSFLSWKPAVNLETGLRNTYRWVEKQSSADIIVT